MASQQLRLIVSLGLSSFTTVILAPQQRPLAITAGSPVAVAAATLLPFIRRNTEGDKGNIVSQVVPRVLGSVGGPVQAVDLPAEVLDDDRHRLYRLLVAHRARWPVAFLALELEVAGGVVHLLLC